MSIETKTLPSTYPCDGELCPRCGSQSIATNESAGMLVCANDHRWGADGGPVVEGAPTVEPVAMICHPPHYCQGAVEAIDAIASALGRDGFIAYIRGCIVKYTWRMMHKGKPLEDAQKLGWYQRRLVETLERLK